MAARVTSPVLVLVLDTATPAVTAALVDTATGVLATRITVDPRAHAEVLIPQVLACLAEAGRGAAELGAVVCGTGPGPYTGLRVGMVTALSWGDALGIGVHGVCSLDGIGGSAEHPGELLVVTDARRREVYWARYRNGVRTAGPGVCAPGDLDPGAATAVAGSLPHARSFGLPVLGPEHPDPAALLAAADLAAPPPPVVPRYLRRPDATTPAGSAS